MSRVRVPPPASRNALELGTFFIFGSGTGERMCPDVSQLFRVAPPACLAPILRLETKTFPRERNQSVARLHARTRPVPAAHFRSRRPSGRARRPVSGRRRDACVLTVPWGRRRRPSRLQSGRERRGVDRDPIDRHRLPVLPDSPESHSCWSSRGTPARHWRACTGERERARPVRARCGRARAGAATVGCDGRRRAAGATRSRTNRAGGASPASRDQDPAQEYCDDQGHSP